MLKYMRQFGSPAWVVKSEDFVNFLDMTYQAQFFGEIWLYNNDLKVISDYDIFKPLYLDRIAENLAAKVDAVKVIVSKQHEAEIFSNEGSIPKGDIRDNLLAMAAKGDADFARDRLATFYFAKMSEAEIKLPPVLRKLPDPYTIVFYNHRDSIGLTPGIVIVRHNVFPFVNSDGEKESRFAVVWQIKDQKDIHGRLREAFKDCFKNGDYFYHIDFNPDKKELKLQKGWSPKTLQLQEKRRLDDCIGLSVGDEVDVAVVASQWSELVPLRRRVGLTYPTPILNDHYQYTLVRSAGDGQLKKVLLAVVGQGNISSACRMWDIIEKWKPKKVILCGVAGGDPDAEDQKLGDVVICEKVVGYEHGKLVDGDFRPRPTVHEMDHDLIVAAERIFGDCKWTDIADLYPGETFRPPKLLRFAIASGSKLIADKVFFKYVRRISDEKVHATEMEGDGVGYACQHNQHATRLLIIKAIMDMSSSVSRKEKINRKTMEGGERKVNVGRPKGKDEWKEYASAVAALLVHKMLPEILD